MLTITDIFGNEEALSGYRGLKRFRNVSGEKTLAFLILPTEQNGHSFHMVQEESIVEFKGDSYRIKQVTEKNKGNTFYKEVVAIHTLFDLIDDHQYETFTGSMTFQAALQFVFAGTGYTWSVIDTFYAQAFEDFGDDNRLSLFQDVLQRYGAEFTLNGTFLTFKKKIGNSTDFQFRYNYNIKTISKNINTNNLSTYIKGFGKDIESEYTSPNAAIFGIRHAKPIRDERYTTLEGLDERLQEINDTPEVSITIDFVDMRRAGYPYDVPNEGDYCFLIFEPMNNLDLEARIMDITEEFTEFSDYPIKTEVTLANYRKNMTDTLIEFSRTTKTVNDIVGGNQKLPYNVLDDAVKRATEALQSAQTELEFVNGIIARSKENPNHLVLLNSAGVGISTDGGQTFTDAITYLGVNTSLLTAGQINANNITVRGGTETAYTLIDVDGLTIKGGAIRIERPDGYVSMDDGILRNSFSVQGSEPPFQAAGITLNGQFFRSASTGRTENVQRFTFKHDSRYIRIICNMYTVGNAQAGNVGSMAFDVFDDAETQSITSVVVTENRLLPSEGHQGHRKDILLDLGTPTGQIYVMYWRMWNSVEGWYVNGSVRYIVQEG